MIRQVIGRNVARSGRLANAAVVRLNRFQSTTAAEAKPEVEEAVQLKSDSTRQARTHGKSASSRQPRATNANGTPRYFNQKLRDITSQVKSSVDSAKVDDLTEATKIFEEGLVYLRQIQKSEGIPEDVLYGIFQGLSLTLFQKASLLSKDSAELNQVFDLLVENNVAHGYHFAQMIANCIVTSGASGPAYGEALSLWIKYLEYSSIQPGCKKFFKCYTTGKVQYYRTDVINLTFYAYVQSLIEQDIQFDPKFAYKVLQTDDLPSVFQVGQTVVRYKVKPSMEEYRRTFGDAIDSINIESTDPNGPIVINRLVTAVERRNGRGITKVYEQILAASQQNGKKIQELTLIRIMSGFAELQEFDKVLEIFQDMIKLGISKPLTYSWETMLFAMCHPSRTTKNNSNNNNSSIEDISSKLEKCLATMEQNGNKLSAKTVSIIIGCYSNLNKFDKVEEILKQEGKWSGIPIVHLAKNNYLNGLILNHRVASAELKLKEFQKADPTFVPSILVLNSFLNFYVGNKNFKAVDGILQYMKEQNIKLDLATYTILIDMHFKINREMGQSASIETIFELISDANSNNIKLNEVTMGTLINGLSKDGSNLEAARLLFKYVQQKMRLTPHLTTSMLETELEFGSIPELKKLFESYLKDFNNGERIWNLMIRGLLKRDDALALEYFDKFKRQQGSAKPNNFTYYYMLSHYLKKDNKIAVQTLINDLNSGGLQNLGTQLPKILNGIRGQYQVNESLIRETVA